MGTKQEPLDIIIIDDDESIKTQTHYVDDRDNTHDIDANYSDFNEHSNEQHCQKSSNVFGVGHSDCSGKYYDDDCFVVQRGAIKPVPSHSCWSLHRRAPKGEKRPAIFRHDLKYSSSSSDCEIIEDLDGKIRQDWERAALKKRFGNSYMGGSFRAESEESTSAPCSGPRLGLFGKGEGPFQQNHCKIQNANSNSGPSCNLSDKDKDFSQVTLLDQQDSNDDIADTRSEDTVGSSGEETSVTDTRSFSSANNPDLLEEGASCSDHNVTHMDSCPSERIQSEDELDRQEDVPVQHRATAQAAAGLPTGNLFFVQKAVRGMEELEWAQCQENLQSQAKEGHCEQKKRRIDNEKKPDMENMQKQRLEEFRLMVNEVKCCR